MLNYNKLSLLVTNRCPLDCAHCLCSKTKISDLSSKDYSTILEALRRTEIKTVQFTGGEPFLRLPIIHELANYILQHFNNAKFEIITSGFFASAEEKCSKIISQIENLSKIIISYDKFHERFVPFEYIERLKRSAELKGIDVRGFATITEPADLLKIKKYEERLNIPFDYQKVLPIGNAREFGTYYKSDESDDYNWNRHCPNITNLVYMPSYGFTFCCSSLFFNSSETGKKAICQPSVNALRDSEIFKLLNNKSFVELKANIKPKKLLSSNCSQICALCETILKQHIEKAKDES